MKNKKKLLFFLALLIVYVFVLLVIPEGRKEMNSPHFRILFSNSIDSSGVAALAAVLEDNYGKIGNDLKTIPPGKIETNIYASRWRYIKVTKNWAGSGNIEGTGKLHFMNRAWGENDSKKVAVHEFAHTVVLKLLLDQEQQPLNVNRFDKKFSTFPLWLWEAVSVYEANQFVDPKSLPYLRDGKYPSLHELSNSLKGGKIYSCGYTIVEYITSRYGQLKLIELLRSYGDIKKVFNVSEQQFSLDWYEFVKEKYL